jgi:predicted nucleic acid-binding Zn ribbon protein
MRRLSELLPEAAAGLGIEADLQRARLAAAWERIVEERVPAAAGASRLVGLEAGGLVVAADDHAVAQELRLRAPELLEAIARAPGTGNLRGLRVVVRQDPSGDRRPTSPSDVD